MEKTITIEGNEQSRDALREAQAHRDSALSAFNTANSIFRKLLGGSPKDVQKPGLMSGKKDLYEQMLSIVAGYEKDLNEKEQKITSIKADMFDSQK